MAEAPLYNRDADGQPLDVCFICAKPFVLGDRVLPDVDCGDGHAACFGPEREGYVKDIDTGEPLGPDDPIPTGRLWEPDLTPDQRAVLEALAGRAPEYRFSFAWFSQQTGFARRTVQIACRELRAKGLLVFERGLFNENDGTPYGSGYGLSDDGAALTRQWRAQEPTR